MPPRYAYWTILVDGQPTAFRAAMQEDLMPTLKRLKDKHPSAEMKWFQNGKLWNSRLDAQEAMLERGERGRMGDKRQGGGFRERKKFGSRQNAGENFSTPEPERGEDGKLDWKPKGEFTPAPKRADRESKPSSEWKPKKFAAEGRRDWKPKGEFTPAPKRERSDRAEWKPKGEWKPREERSFKKPGGFKSSRPPSRFQERRPARPRDDEKLEWKPKGEFTPAPKRERSERSWTPKSGHTGAKPEGGREKRKWIPKEEYKKSQGIEARRDKNWRPGGEHKDPRQKYKDAKKAKWTKFKTNIRQRWEKKQGAAPRKRRDEE
jgi:hypothetical protein